MKDMVVRATPVPATAQVRISTELSARQGQRVITNIGELMEALAVDWTEEYSKQRELIAGEGGTFVRVPARSSPHNYFKPQFSDIPCSAKPYSLIGFIRFEAPAMFPGLFEVADSGDGTWYSARLTRKGFDAAKTGVLTFELNPDVQRVAFFNPPTRVIEPDVRLVAPKKKP